MHDAFLIGGSPSSGSTLLVSLLNDHDNILCLPETGLFVHGQNLVDAGADTAENNLNLHLPWVNTGAKVAQAIGLDLDAYDKAIKDYPTAFDLLRAYVNTDRSVYLIEKTPENIFAFYPYLAASSENRVVLTIRDAMSVTQSLSRRGFTMVEALLIWFGHSYETVRLIRDFPEQVYQCTYEQLTKSPTWTVNKIIDFWGINPKQKQDKSTHQHKLVYSDELNHTYESLEMIDFLVSYSSWNLAGTAWTKSLDAKVHYTEPVNLLGLDYQVLVEDLMFKTNGDGLLKTTDIEDFLSGKISSLTPVKDSNAIPLEIAKSSGFIRSLLECYPPYISKA